MSEPHSEAPRICCRATRLDDAGTIGLSVFAVRTTGEVSATAEAAPLRPVSKEIAQLDVPPALTLTAEQATALLHSLRDAGVTL